MAWYAAMRRKRIRTIFWLAAAGSATMAMVGPRLGSLQSTAALAFAPISHPANRVSGLLLGAQVPVIASPGESARESGVIAEENQRLRQRIENLQGQLASLQQLHADRQLLGQEVLERCIAARVIGSDRDVLQVVGTGRGRIVQGMPALHYGQAQRGLAGVVSAAGAGGAQVRLISDPSVRVTGRFGRFDSKTGAFVVLNTEPPLIEGMGDGMCRVARAKREELEREGLRVGDWAVLADNAWPEHLTYFRIGQVVAIEDIPAEPGFARILIRPAVELRRLRELMVYVTDGG